jgi:hypothetical protein
MLGSENLHSVGRDVTGPASSADNAIAKYDGITGGIMQDSSILIDDTNNLSSAKSITFTSSVANPGAIWYNAGLGLMNIGSAKYVAVGTVLGFITTGGSNIDKRVGARSNYTMSETNNIIVGTNVVGTTGESNRIRIGDSSHNNLYIGNRAMYKSTGGNCSFGSAPTATGTANSAFGSGALKTLTTGASNTAVDWSTMFVATTSGANCAFGHTVLGSLTTGNSNIAIDLALVRIIRHLNQLIL